MKHVIKMRVYYEDTDAQSVVYYANYLKFAERGRSELLRCEGFENKSLKDNHGVVFVARHMEVDYLIPAYLDDLLEVRTEVLKIKNASFVMRQQVFRGDDLISSMDITLVCVGSETVRPVGLSDEIKQALEKYLIEG